MDYRFAKTYVQTEAEYLDALQDGYLNIELPADRAPALFALLTAQKDTSPMVTYAYAMHLLVGVGCEEDPTTAFNTLLSLADSGFTPAYKVVATCYAEGRGTEPSPLMADLWAKKAENETATTPVAEEAPTAEAEEAPAATEEAPVAEETSTTEEAPVAKANPFAKLATGAFWKAFGKSAWAKTKTFCAPYKFTGFKLAEKKTNIRTEALAGLTTFFAMAYIIFVQPTYLSQTGMPAGGVMIATCVAAALGTLLTAFLANVPFAQAPGMGLNAFFTFTLCFGMGYTWGEALAVVFISGLAFLIIAVSPLRGKIIAAIPAPMKAAISAGIGLFITFIGLLNADIVVLFGGVGDYSDMGDIFSPATGLALVGLLITSVLLVLRVRGAITLGIIITTLIGFIPVFGQSVLPTDWSLGSKFSEFGDILFKVDIGGAFTAKAGFMGLLTAVISCLIVDMFDTVGTLLGTAGNSGMLDEDGNFPDGDRALVADAIATCVGACMGTSTVTTYVESSTGIKAGGKTGLTSAVTGALFFLCIFLAPIAGIVPSAATAPAMIIVGVFMMQSVLRVAWDDLEEAIPCFLTVVMMPFSYSISDGIGFGMITWCLLKLVKGKAKEVNPITYGIAGIFLLMYIMSKVFA